MTDNDEPSEERPELDLPDSEETLDEEEPELDEWWSWGNFARLFIFPLIIVVVSVSIYGVFQMMLRDQTSINEYITQMQTGPENERWRAAYSLAQSVRRQEAQKKLTRSSVNSIIDLYRGADQPRMRQYLALVLGEVPIEESVEALESGLQKSDPGVKVNSALALGKLYEKASGGPLEERIQSTAPKIAELLDDESMEVRRMAAFVLGSLNNRSVIDDLKKTLNDSAREVRWNGAIALGWLGNDSGQGILLDVLERDLDGNFEDWRPGLRRNLLTNVMDALVQLDVKKARPLLRKIKENHPDSKVRGAALKALEDLGNG